MTDTGPFTKLACECELALQEELAALAAEKHEALGDLQGQVGRLQEQVARAQVAPSPAQVRTRSHTYTPKAFSSS